MLTLTINLPVIYPIRPPHRCKRRGRPFCGSPLRKVPIKRSPLGGGLARLGPAIHVLTRPERILPFPLAYIRDIAPAASSSPAEFGSLVDCRTKWRHAKHQNILRMGKP